MKKIAVICLISFFLFLVFGCNENGVQNLPPPAKSLLPATEPEPSPAPLKEVVPLAEVSEEKQESNYGWGDSNSGFEIPLPAQPPERKVLIYKGFWFPVGFMFDEQQPLMDVNLLKDVGANIVAFGPNVKINAQGEARFDFPVDYIEYRLAQLAERYYKEDIRIHLVIETLFVRDFSETTPAGGPGAFPSDVVQKPGFFSQYNQRVEELAQLAEKYRVEFFSPMNEPDLKLGHAVASQWGQEVLPHIKKHYSGKVLYKAAFMSMPKTGLNFKGYDALGMDPSPGGGPQGLNDYPQDIKSMIDMALGFAKRDNVPQVLFTEFGVWGGALSFNEEQKATAHKIVFEQGKGKVQGFLALDPPPDLDRSLKETKSLEEIKIWFKEKLG